MGFPDLVYDPKVDDYRAMKDYSSSFSETAMVSYFGRLAYNYYKKYLLEVTVRRDGSSLFGADVRWATFPSVAAGVGLFNRAFHEVGMVVELRKSAGKLGTFR